MNKRNVATILWFLMGWTAGSVAAVLAGLPSTIGLLVGVPFAAAVRYGPVGRLWDARPADNRRRMPADEYAAGLERGAADSAPATGDRASV
jgi:hypothetical protein